MAKKGTTRLRITTFEARVLELWLIAWQPPPAGLLPLTQLNAEVLGNDGAARSQRLRSQFSKIVRRRRRLAGEIEILIDREDLRWLVREVSPSRGIFGKSAPARSYLPPFVRGKLLHSAGKHRGRRTLSRRALEAGGAGTDQRHKKRLAARLKCQRLNEEWIERRRQSGLPTGLLHMFDPDDPHPNLPKLKPLLGSGFV